MLTKKTSIIAPFAMTKVLLSVKYKPYVELGCTCIVLTGSTAGTGANQLLPLINTTMLMEKSGAVKQILDRMHYLMQIIQGKKRIFKLSHSETAWLQSFSRLAMYFSISPVIVSVQL